MQLVLWLPCLHRKKKIWHSIMKTKDKLSFASFPTYPFSIFLLFFTISISILISIFHFVSISRSTSILWISRFQDQYQYLGKSNFEINIKINMTNILKNIGKSIYCPIPDFQCYFFGVFWRFRRVTRRNSELDKILGELDQKSGWVRQTRGEYTYFHLSLES